jgi:hypothetical protein
LVHREVVPSSAENLSVRVGNRQGPSRRCDRGRCFGRGRDEIVLLVELVLHHIDQRGGQRFELAIDPAETDPPLLPQHVGAEQTQDHEQRDRVPDRQPRPQRDARHDGSLPMDS